jgi:hypothetical protein
MSGGIEETQAKLLEVLTNGSQEDRVYAIADILFQFETYTRNASMTLGGLLVKHELPLGATRDIFSVRQMLDELSSWLVSHYGPLYRQSGINVPEVQPTTKPQVSKLH